MTRPIGNRPVPTAEVMGSNLSSNGSGPEVRTFSVWRRQSTQWNSINRFRSGFRNAMGPEAKLKNGPGRRFYLITPADGEIILEYVDETFSEMKGSLNSGIAGLHRDLSLGVKGFALSPKDKDGNKTVSLKLGSESSDNNPEEQREKLLKSVGAVGLVLPEIETEIDIATVPANAKKKDLSPLMEKHIPAGMTLSFCPAVLTYMTKRPDNN